MNPKPKREELHEWDARDVWHPFTQMAEYEPLLIERAEGCTLFDDKGRAYLDGVSSLWCNVHGHRHPRLDAALVEQLGKIAHSTSLGASNSTTVRLAKRLTEIAPPGLNHVFFAGDGAAAVEAALKIAFQYWRQCEQPRPEKTAFAALGEAYHGDTIGGVSVGGVDRFNAVFAPLLFETVRIPSPNPYRLPAGVRRENALEHYVAQAERILSVHKDRIAALVVEPIVQGAAGMIVHPPSYLRALREITRKYDILLIADEIAVGFGRTGTMFACEQEQVSPDLMCVGKGLTGGYLPMSAALATTEIWNAFLGTANDAREFCHGHTYAGNPLSAAVALASLDVFEDDRVLECLRPKIARLRKRLASLADHPHVGDIRQSGLIAGIELARSRNPLEDYPWQERRAHTVCRTALEHGVLLRPLGNVVVIMPPLAISLEEIDKIVAAVAEGIKTATRES